MLSSTTHRFKPKVKPEIVKPFSQVQGRKSYIRRIKGLHIENILVGWLFESGGYFSYIKNRMKREAKMGQLETTKELARAGWPIIVPQVLTWINTAHQPITIIPVPSRFGAIEKLAAILSELINKERPNSCIFKNDVLTRRRELPIKRYIWKEREKIAADMYSLARGKTTTPSVLIVDDVVSSGASLRRCALLLKSIGAERICATTLAGDPYRQENWTS